MRVQRVAWLSFCGVVGVTGAMAALTWALPTLILLFVLAALTGAAATMVALTPVEGTQVKRQQWPLIATNTVVSGAGTVAFVGLGSLLGAPMAALVLALAVGGSPYVAPRWIGERGPRPHRLPDLDDRGTGLVQAAQDGLSPDEARVAPGAGGQALKCL